VAPSAIPITTQIFTPDGLADPVTPRALELSEIPQIVNQYKQGAENAKVAGFDGVEVHGANGYLLDQFLRDGSNKREDEYGGSVENRARLLIEVLHAVSEVWDSERIGLRISPIGSFNDMSDSNPEETYTYLLKEISKMKLSYLHVVEALPFDKEKGLESLPQGFYKQSYSGIVMLNSGYTAETAEKAIADGHADLISFGVPFIANPDLPERFAQGAPLNEADQSTFYGGGEQGYTDYPFLGQKRT
jgi:N-ethylmaleimide reductase